MPTPEPTPFLFLANNLALDFLNTRPILDGQPAELLPDFPALLNWARQAGLLTPRQANTLLRIPLAQQSAAHTEALALRERLRTQILAWESGAPISPATINHLNSILAAHPIRTRLTPTPTGLTTETYLAPDSPAALLAPIAQSAAELFTTADPARVRKCDNCVLHFHDTSKKGVRRWCSMTLCGNRAKVAAYQARHRSPSAE